MHYQISRNGQTYGPYTLDDLRRYVGTGNVLATDQVKSESMPVWMTVEQLLADHPEGAAAATVAQPAFAEVAQPVYADPAQPVTALPQQAYPQQAYPQQVGYADPMLQPGAINPALASSPYEDAPNLHWGLVLLFSALTCFTLFNFIWDVVIAAWLRRVQPTDRSMFWYFGALGVEVLRWILTLLLAASFLPHNDNPSTLFAAGLSGLAAVKGLLFLVMLGLMITGNFVKRASLLEHFNGPEPVGLQLSGVMTFFFAPYYFQYHLNRINSMKQAARYGAARGF